MWPKHWLSVLGLGIEAVGVAMIFVWGPPQPDFKEGVSLGLEDGTRLPDGRTVAEHAAEARAVRKHYRRMATIALSLIFIGLVLQFIDAWFFD